MCVRGRAEKTGIKRQRGEEERNKFWFEERIGRVFGMAAAIIRDLPSARGEMAVSIFTCRLQRTPEDLGNDLCSVSPQCVIACTNSYSRCTTESVSTSLRVMNKKISSGLFVQPASVKKTEIAINFAKHAGRPNKIHRSSSVVMVRADGSGESEYELRVCTHRSCRKSGSLQTLELLRGLAPPNVAIESCGCLGRCGSGPNLVVLPVEMFVSHCSTAAHAARLLAIQCGASDPDNNLKALSLKQQGNKAFEAGDIVQAEMMYSQAIDMKPSGGLHLLYANRSAARLAKGDADAALEDAIHAAHCAPKWHTALLRQGEAYMSIGDYHAAHAAFSKALLLDPSLRRSKSYQIKVRELETKLTPVKILS